MNEIKQTLIPLTLFTFGLLVIIIVILLIYKYLNKRLCIKAVQNIIKDNQELTPTQIQAIISPPSTVTDARKGFIGTTLALGFILFALIMGSNGYALAQSSLFGMSMFPLLLGLTHLYFHFFDNKNK